MPFPNVTDLVATTIESRSKKIADNVTKNNALYERLQKRGNTQTFAGGTKIIEEFSFAANNNAGWYSGFDLLPMAAQDVISGAEFEIKQAACPVVMSGLEELQNAGKEQMIDLLASRIEVAEASMANMMSDAAYGDGTGAGGKELVGLDAMVSTTPTTGTYGGVDRASWTFWRNQYTLAAAAYTAATVQGGMNTMWASLVRGADRPDLILMDSLFWTVYLASLQTLQRFTSADQVAGAGFPSVKFMDADCVLDGGIGGFAAARTAYFLNTKYIKFRPHAKRNMVTLNPNKRYAVNQDAEVSIMAWAGNITCRGAQYQGRLAYPA